MDNEKDFATKNMLKCEPKKNSNFVVKNNKQNSEISTSNVFSQNESVVYSENNSNSTNPAHIETVTAKKSNILLNMYHNLFKQEKKQPSNLKTGDVGFQETSASVNVLDNQKPDEPITLNKKNNKNTKQSSGFLSKIFLTKNSKIVALVGLACVLLLFMFSFSKFTTNKSSSSENFNNVSYTSSSNFTKELESKLVRVLGKIKGAGNVDVMVTLESGPELIIAKTVDKKTNTVTNGDNSTTTVTVVETPIIITKDGESKPLVLLEIMPKIKGVIIVSQGAGDVKTKLALLEAVQSILGVNGNNIQIFESI